MSRTRRGPPLPARAHRRAMDFLDLVCHDLRTPACTIAGFADLLLDYGKDPVSPEQRASLERIRKNAHFMLDLISSLMDMVRLDTGRLRLTCAPTDLRELIRETAQGAMVLATLKQIFVLAELPEDRLRVPIDRPRMMQVIANLLTNAIKFSRPGTTIQIGARPHNGGALFWVCDEGPGIPTKDRERLFSKFARLSVKPTAGEKSTGLGLWIVKQIVQLHGGTIEVESSPAEGSTFRVWLPGQPVTRHPRGTTI
jgi:signal transduction histidine kinase